MRLNTFIFDLDGTILDTLPDLVVLTNIVLARHGFAPRTTSEILSFVGNGAAALMMQAVPAGTSREVAEAVTEDWRRFYPQYPNDLTVAYPRVRETLVALRKMGCKLGVLSNKFDGGVHQIINQCLPDLFDVMHGECAEYPRKPDPSGLLKTIAELHSTPECTAYVGDSPGDILVAQRAGTFAVGVSWGYREVNELREAGADIIIDNFCDLLNYAEDVFGASAN